MAKIGFNNLKNKLSKQKGVKNPAALAASIGRKKYGKEEMSDMASCGRSSMSSGTTHGAPHSKKY